MQIAPIVNLVGFAERDLLLQIMRAKRVPADDPILLWRAAPQAPAFKLGFDS